MLEQSRWVICPWKVQEGEGDEGRLDAQLSQRADEGSSTRNEKARLGCSEMEKEGEGVGTCPVERCP